MLRPRLKSAVFNVYRPFERRRLMNCGSGGCARRPAHSLGPSPGRRVPGDDNRVVHQDITETFARLIEFGNDIGVRLRTGVYFWARSSPGPLIKTVRVRFGSRAGASNTTSTLSPAASKTWSSAVGENASPALTSPAATIESRGRRDFRHSHRQVLREVQGKVINHPKSRSGG